jgi:hypothetical protein
VGLAWFRKNTVGGEYGWHDAVRNATHSLQGENDDFNVSRPGAIVKPEQDERVVLWFGRVVLS